jgi:hypothetical protein
MKKNRFLLAALALLLVWLPVFISCANAASDDASGPGITGYVATDDETVAPELPRYQVTGGPVNPPGLEVEVTKKPDGSTLFEAEGNVGQAFPNTPVTDDFNAGGTYLTIPAGTYVSSMVITGIVDPSKQGTIRQYNQAFNLYAPQSNFYNQYTPNVYKEKYYTGGAGSYYPDALGGFDVLLWSGATSKIITLEVTQDGVTKTYIIDYSDTVFNP